MLRLISVVAIAALVQAGAPPARAGRQQPTFRSSVDYVEVDVVVTDASGNFVPGLDADDFELLEDSAPQTIATFDEIAVPLPSSAVARAGDAMPMPAPSDIASNEATAEGRIYLLVLDDLHTRPTSTPVVRRQARAFIERYVGPNDLAAVLHTSRTDAGQDFTSNHELLLASVDAFQARGLTSAVLNRIEDKENRAGTRRESETAVPRDRDAPEREQAARRLFDTLANLTDYLASVSGRRKALLLFSEGTDLMSEGSGIGSEGSFSRMNNAATAMHEAIARATRANVHIYPVDASGIADPGPSADIRRLEETTGLDASALARERRAMQGTLRTVADSTGGVAIVNTNNLDAGFARVVRENSHYYLLGYYPPDRRDGKFHAFSVRVKRPGLQVRARAGYYAPAGAVAKPAVTHGDPLDALLAAAVPSPQLPIRVAAPAFALAGDKAQVWVAVDLPADAFRFDASSSETLRLKYQMVDPSLKVVTADGQEIRLQVPEQTRVEIERLGFRVVFPLHVDAGHYRLRLAASTETAGRQGSVFADVIVPEFAADGLTWSGVSLSSLAAIRVPTRPGDIQAARRFPLLPSAVRAFKAGDLLAAYAEIHGGRGTSAATVDLSAVVRDEQGRVVFTRTEERPAAELAASTGGYGMRVEIPSAGWAPGAYVLTLTATPRSTPGAAVTRVVPFTIAIS